MANTLRGMSLTKKKTAKRQRPKLALSHKEIAIDAIWDYEGYVEKVQFTGGQLPSFEDERISFDDVIFKKVSLSGNNMRTAEFVDVIFQACDFSNANFENAVFHRCEFINSKVTGTDFANAKIGHTLFDACDGKYSNFSFSGMREVEFKDSNLTDAEFYECKFKDVRFLTCKMDDVNFGETELNGVDLSSNTYGRIEVTLPKLSGCIVSKDQAIGFARILGLTVKEE